ncbi:sugar transferase [Vibrio cyclitrophicus 1F289]|nr:sugar transferase [Vibrio cyclitrophicus 1F289]PMF10692.1 sugar transferase [Vibrio cyclitrophicus]
MMKRLFDILATIMALLLLSPLMVLVSIFIIVEDRGSPLFKQLRVGKGGEVFGIYKFRSMKTNAEKLGPYYTEKNDPRITKVGAFIRKTSIDELPQLINVLLGHMSIVGPRPDVPVQQANYTKEQWDARISIKPGITGLAQATARSCATPEQRIQLDMKYINNNDFMFDMKIILMTIKQVICKGGN